MTTNTRNLLAFLDGAGRPVAFRSAGCERWSTKRLACGQHVVWTGTLRPAVRSGYVTATENKVTNGHAERVLTITARGREALEAATK